MPLLKLNQKIYILQNFILLIYIFNLLRKISILILYNLQHLFKFSHSIHKSSSKIILLMKILYKISFKMFKSLKKIIFILHLFYIYKPIHLSNPPLFVHYPLSNLLIYKLQGFKSYHIFRNLTNYTYLLFYPHLL